MKSTCWSYQEIKHLFKVQLGKMLSKKAMQGDLFPYLANFNVRWGKFDLSHLNKMNFTEKEKIKFILRQGDLLVCEGGEIGRCAVWNSEIKTIYYQKALHSLRPISSNILSKFIYFYIHYISFTGNLSKLVGETSIAHLTREKLLCLKIPVPRNWSDPPRRNRRI